MSKTCRRCSTEFAPNRDWLEFCCTEHQQAWNRHDRKRREVQTYEWLKANGRSKALKKIVRDLQAGKPTPDVARRNPEANGEPEFRRRF
jgi:hypothetical protein